MPSQAGQLTAKAEGSLLTQITDCLKKRGCNVHQFWISTSADELILHGRVSTYYAKQLAQCVVMEMLGTPILTNDIEVV